MKFYQTPRFKALETEWDERLASSGFTDIEKKTGEDKSLKQFASNAHRQAGRLARESKALYYNLIAEGLYRDVFKNEIHKHIMQGVADGKKLTHIHRELCRSGTIICYEYIRLVVKRFEYRWGIKNYTPKQMWLVKPPTKL